MNYKEEDIVYYERTNDVVNCYLKFESKEIFNIYNLAYDYDYVTIGDKLLRFSNNSSLKQCRKEISILARDEGYFVNKSSCIERLYPGYHLYTIYKTLDAFQNSIFPSSFFVGEDDFTHQPFIEATLYGGNKYGFPIGWIFLRFEYKNNKHILNIDFNSKEIKFSKNHSLSFLLEDGNLLHFSDFKKPIKYSKNPGLFDNINMTTSTTLSDQDIKALSSKKVIKWQLINEEGVVLIELDFPSRKDQLDDFKRKIFLDFFVRYLSLYNEIKADECEEINEVVESNKSCYVYLMVDTTNNFHKIGISNNPKYREHTLQSDKPTIELLCAKEYPTRIIAEAIELALHKAFSNKRIRGEWFNLDASDIDEIKKTLK